jgi:flavin reductase (DIM6/NTAB) family NADH-FMN oxidoreductase RutF
MIYDPRELDPAAMYRLMISVVVPRPIAFVSTIREDGGFNVAPFSYFIAITNKPPLLGVSMNARAGGPKDTLRNLRASGDFVINVVDETLGERMVRASGEWPPEVDEFELTGLTPVPSEVVKAPRVGESPVSLECTLHREIPLGDASFVVGEIVRAHVDDRVIVDGRVDPMRLAPLGRLGGNAYSPLREVIRMDRPVVARDTKPAG